MQLLVAWQSMVPVQPLATWQKTEQLVPPQVMAAQALLLPQATLQLVELEQSIPPLQALLPVQSTRHGIPAGQCTEVHGFAVLQ